jgi:DNA-binding SARP family transcriptional activator
MKKPQRIQRERCRGVATAEHSSSSPSGHARLPGVRTLLRTNENIGFCRFTDVSLAYRKCIRSSDDLLIGGNSSDEGSRGSVVPEFGVLGPIRAASGAAIAVLPAKERIALATLLLGNGQVISTSALIEALWDEDPPPGARNGLQGHIKQLRRLLGPSGGRIITKAPGYLIEVRPGELDLDRFTRLTDRAGSAATAGDWADAATLLNEALALWRGEPLSDVPSLILQRNEAPRLAELRAQALDGRIEADLRSGRHDEVTPELRQLVAAHPHRERSWGQLMLALYRGGRPGEALAAYQEARRILHEDLGVNPGRQLQELQQRILTADSALHDDMTGSSPAAQSAARPDANGHPPWGAPAQLPADTADFTGRSAQVDLLCGLLAAEPAAGRAGAVVISAVAGMGGIGKTALAVHAAHRLRDRYPGGQLFVCLQGATCALRPAEVLARFLRDLGVPDAAIPAGQAERAARYRTLLTDRRMLIVLDDARDAAQVRPLLPGTAGCAVLITSRSALPGLPGTALLNLAALDQPEASDLFSAIIGADRAAAEPDATAAVLACCAGLPLAVRITASRLASRPHWSIAHLAARLAVEQDRLAELAAGDLAVRASFAVSYDALPVGRPDPARVFRLLGLADLAVISLPAVAALAGRPAGEVAAALEILADASLLESPAAGRFRLHDLLRSYAAELAGDADSAQDRNAALERMLGWYGGQAVSAARTLAPGRALPATVAVQAAATAAMDGPAQALDWYETERASLLAAARRAAALGRHDIAAQIAVAMWDFFQRTTYTDDWLAISQTGVDSARHLGDDAVLSWLLNGLGQVHGPQRKFADSHRFLSEALAIRQRTGDRHGEAAVLNSLAVDLFYQDRFDDALEYLRPGLAIHIELGEQPDAAIILNNMGHALLCLRRHAEALEHLGQALAIQQETGARHAEGITQTTIAQVNLDLGRFEAAVEHYRKARTALLDESIREHVDQADILHGLGTALAALGRAGEAREAWLAAIPILDRAGDPRAAELTARLTDPGAASRPQPADQPPGQAAIRRRERGEDAAR